LIACAPLIRYLLCHQMVILLQLSIWAELIWIGPVVESVRHWVVLFIMRLIIVIYGIVTITLEWRLSRLINCVNTIDLLLLIIRMMLVYFRRCLLQVLLLLSLLEPTVHEYSHNAKCYAYCENNSKYNCEKRASWKILNLCHISRASYDNDLRRWFGLGERNNPYFVATSSPLILLVKSI
jgi:hypothetical protein